VQRDELADFLRVRRETLRPQDLGLPVGARRRTPGLRREEVAAQAGMSADYYTRLEQGRSTQPSTPVLAALARALRLTHDERDYLFRLCGHAPPDRTDGLPHVAPALQRVLDRLEDTPALIISDLGETLLANRMATALFGDHTAFTGLERMDAYRWFTVPGARGLYPPEDHERHSRSLVANLRAAYGAAGERSRAGDLVAALLARSPEFAALWARHEVARRFEEHKTLVHPELGPIELDCQVLFTEDQAQMLLTLTAVPGTAAVEQLQLLGVIGSQRFSPAGP
jgi:transcriptional regulator with XRE-family HTH domain